MKHRTTMDFLSVGDEILRLASNAEIEEAKKKFDEWEKNLFDLWELDEGDIDLLRYKAAIFDTISNIARASHIIKIPSEVDE